MLPNLSCLSIGAPKRERSFDDASDASPASPKTQKSGDDYEWKFIQNVSFTDMVRIVNQNKSDEFSVFIKTVPNDDSIDAPVFEFEIKYSPEKKNVYMTLESSNGFPPCVRASFEEVNNSIYLSDLFHEIYDAEEIGDRVECKMTPEKNQLPGAGNYVLSILTQIASQMDYTVTLYDASKFASILKPENAISSSLFIHQGVERGFGYYQARGFVSKPNFDMVKKERGTLSITDYEAVMRFDLDYLHLVNTTPIGDLYDTMRKGHELLNIPGPMKAVYNEDFFRNISMDQVADLFIQMENLGYRFDSSKRGFSTEVAALYPFENLSLRQIHMHYNLLEEAIGDHLNSNVDLLSLLKNAFDELVLSCNPTCLPISRRFIKQVFYEEEDKTWYEVVPVSNLKNGVHSPPDIRRRPIPGGRFRVKTMHVTG